MNTPNPYAPPQAAVADVAATGGLEKADRLIRLVAAILDGIIAGILIYGPLFATGSFGALVAAAARQQLDAAAVMGAMAAGGTFMLVGALAWAVITYILVQRNGQTIAKKLLGIKVVRVDGSKASVGRIFWLRNVVNTLITMVPVAGLIYGLLDSLWIFGEERRCLHDKIADTIVVKA